MKPDRNVIAAISVTAVVALLTFYMPASNAPVTGPQRAAARLSPSRTNIDPLRFESARLAPSIGPYRNIFTFEEPPAVHLAPVRRTVITERPAPPAVTTSPQAAHNDVPVPPTLPWHCIGRFGPDNAPFVALANDAHEIVNARTGETIGGQFIIRSIGVESVDVGFVGFPATADKRIAIGH
jgi:hypothetical protein